MTQPKPDQNVSKSLKIRALLQGETLAMTAAMADVHATSFAAGWSAGTLASLLEDPITLGLGAFAKGSSGGLVGFVLLRVMAEGIRDGVQGEAEILTLAVRPAARRRGVARKLLEQGIVGAAASGAQTLFLEVSDANEAARALYKTLGFESVGRRPGYYTSEGGADALVMRLALVSSAGAKKS